MCFCRQHFDSLPAWLIIEPASRWRCMVGRRRPPSSPQQDNILIDRLASGGTFIFQREMRGGGKQGDEMRQRVGGLEMCLEHMVSCCLWLFLLLFASQNIQASNCLKDMTVGQSGSASPIGQFCCCKDPPTLR